MRYIDNDKLRQISFLIIILVLGGLLFDTLKGFIPAFLGALTLYVLMRKWMFRLLHVRKWSPAKSAALLMLTSFIIIMVPVWMVANLLSSRINFAIAHSGELMNSLTAFVGRMEKRTGLSIISETNLQSAGSIIAEKIPTILGETLSTIGSIAMMYFLLYFMLTNGRRMERACSELVPMNDKNTNIIGHEINVMVASNAIGIPLIALAQGLVGLVAYLVLGLHQPFFWFAITCVTSMLPIVGAAMAYVPISLMFFAEGHNWKGIVMAIYGFGVIGTIDNVFRMILQKKLGDTHPLVTILGVIAGASLFGFIGLIFGPLLISLFLLLVKLYSKEFGSNNHVAATENTSKNAEVN
ncbi:MAG: AI-2E family transporter [Chitinophagaceae bacterium]|nr:AI-2E family transporter [Chitinophagaceae bacterium]